jgi:hypothetical protein
MDASVAHYIRTCPSCQANKRVNVPPLGLLQPLPIPSRPWESVSMDFTALPRSRDGHDFAVVFVDRLTKLIKIAPTTSNVTAPATAQLYVDHVLRHGYGVPTSIVSDRDPRFTGHFWTALQGLLGTKLAMSSANHPQTDGQTERANKTIKEMLRAYVGPRQDDWDKHLSLLEFAYNNSANPSTGHTPFYLNHGYHPRLPWCLEPDSTTPAVGRNESAHEFARRMHGIIAEAHKHIRKAQDRQARAADLHRRHHTFAVGDLVWLSSASFGVTKLAPRFLGPFPIEVCVSPVAMRLTLTPALGRRHPVFHVSQLRPYKDGAATFPGRAAPPPPPVMMDGDVRYYTMEAIVGKKRARGGRSRRWTTQYMVKWAGYAESENTWEPAARLREDQPEMVEAYEAAQRA